MNELKPWFVKITGPMRWQIKPYAWQGWAAMGVWMLLLWGVMSLLFLESVRERWWIVTVASVMITAPLILLGIRLAVPLEQLGAARQKEGARKRHGGRRRR